LGGVVVDVGRAALRGEDRYPARLGSTAGYREPPLYGGAELDLGASGADVRLVQERLTELGYDVDADGELGLRTAATVAAFQEERGLPPDGRVDPLTWNALWF
jgi:peptidoglycan hydrolase-like protein with peptidoglycan-binding domain